MPLSAGTRVGPYEIRALIGAGGMGEVYHARDTKLKRDVALKVLPEAIARDPERMARFQREAEVLASLNHPNIAHIYGVEERALAMELVEGETLSSPLPIDTALNYAKQIAEALEYAHERGVIHRDLKPANIKINPDGVVKVLDFGLAKVLEDEPPPSSMANSPTLTLGHTRAGVILGTAAYMSPEQAVGRPVDRRSDIFSFGAVLYEMLAGRRAFAGTTTPDVLEAAVKSDPDWSALPADTPASVVRLIRRCLTKDRKQRLQAIGEARIALENPAVEEPVPVAAPSRALWARLGWGVAAGLLIALGAVSLIHFREKGPPRPIVTRFTFALPEGTVPVAGGIAVSTDGSRLAFAGGPKRQIYVRRMDQLEAMPITGTEGATFLSFSPDGEWISYVDMRAPSQLKKVAVAGGPSQVLAEALNSAATGRVGPPVQNWGPDENILFSSSGVLLRIPSAGGEPQTLATPDANSGVAWYAGSQLLPSGRHALFTMWTRNGAAQAALNLQTGEKKVVLENSGIAQFAQTGLSPTTGHLLYYDVSNGSVMAVAFDANRLQVKGSPVQVQPGVQVAKGPFGSFGFSDSGTLAYIAGAPPGFANNTLVWVDRKGAERPLAVPPRSYVGPAVSPDGESIAVEIDEGSEVNPQTDIWIYGLAHGTLTRFTSDKGSLAPLWTPDAKRLIYSAARGYEVRSAGLDGSSPPTTVSAQSSPEGVNGPRERAYVASAISPDGKMIIGTRVRRWPKGDLQLLSLEGTPSADTKPQHFLDSQFSQASAQFFPVDGRWVAYQSDETGRDEIYVVPYPGPGRKWPISNQGGTEPRWARNGRELFYRNGDKMMAVDVQTSPAFHVSAPKVLFEGHYSPPTNYAASYDVASDGKRFLMLKRAADQPVHSDQLHVVVNWYEELRRRVPGK